MKWVNLIIRYAVGALFVFSGLVKLNDPIGTAIKLHEYFEVFAESLPFFTIFIPIALPLSVIFCISEVVLGVALILHYRIRITLWALMGMLAFFTFLTFYSAYFKKVTDCGCFGDFLKLEPWTSFGKDVVLLALVTVLFVQQKNLTDESELPYRSIAMGGVLLLCSFISYWVLNHLEFVDFRAYKPGANIATLTKNSAPLVYEYIFTNNGQEITLKDWPTDTTLKYKDMKVANPEALPVIKDYKVYSPQGGDFTDSTYLGQWFIVCVQKIKDIDTKAFEDINRTVKDLQAKGVKTIVFTSVSPTEFATFRHEVQLAAPFYMVDATVLKTMIRANPGLMLWNNGTVIAKWHHNDTPSAEDVMKKLK